MSAEMELEDRAFLVAPSGHSTHATQQCDQTGGGIQHFKRIDRDLTRHGYRIGGKLSRARVVQSVAQAVALAVTPTTCSWSTRRVGWGEDSSGKLTYTPLLRPHILALVVDDEGSTLPVDDQHQGSMSTGSTSPAGMHTPAAPLTAAATALEAISEKYSTEQKL